MGRHLEVSVLERLRVKNYRCFSDFSIDFADLNSCVILGRNGAGKTTIASVIQILRDLARKTSRVGDLVKPADMTDQTVKMIELEVEARLFGKRYIYRIDLELPERFRELRVSDEFLSVDGKIVYSRQTSQISLKRSAASDTNFGVDWHVIALPIIQTQSTNDPVSIFKSWLSNIIVLRPTPALMRGESDGETLIPELLVENFGDWFTGAIAESPSSYEPFMRFLREVMPDISSVKNPLLGQDARSIEVEFTENERSFNIPFSRLSDGEKCFFVCALTIAMAHQNRSLTCFWDEPDNYLAPQEVSSTMLALRRAFKGEKQILITSHNPDAMRCFTDESTIILSRSSHLRPPNAKRLAEIDEAEGASVSKLSLWLRDELDE